MGILNKTRCYLIGAMQYADGREWRERITYDLKNMGVIALDPYKKPFITDVDEGEKIRERLSDLMEESNYEEVARIVKRFRSYDLSMVDKSDFVIFNIQPNVPTFGSMEELTTAVKMKRPVFIFVEGGKKKCPLWIFGMIPHEYIYDSMEEVIEVLQKIDSGEIELDNDRWRLFKEEYR
jgi:hypothetical protein